MDNGFENNIIIQKQDTLLFLINEYFLNSNLSSIEQSSEQQDEQISSLMNLLYQHSLKIDSIKAQLYDDKQFNSFLNFSTSTYTKRSYAIGSPLKEKYYSKLFNKDSNSLQNQRKILLKPNENTRGQKNSLFHGLCLTEVNNNDNKSKAIRKIIYPSSLNKKSSHQDMNNTLNYSAFEKNNHHSNRSDFKFKPKKKASINSIKNKDTQFELSSRTRGKSGFKNIPRTPLINKMDSEKVISFIPEALKELLSNSKNESIIRRLFQFFDVKHNQLRTINSLTRKIYLNELLIKTQKKMDLLSTKSIVNETPDNHSKEIIDTSESSPIDNKMEIEIVRHIEAKLAEFVMKSK